MYRTIKLQNYEFFVEYHYEGDPEITTLPNGDPGFPSTRTVVIDGIETESNLVEIFDEYSYDELLNIIKDTL